MKRKGKQDETVLNETDILFNKTFTFDMEGNPLK